MIFNITLYNFLNPFAVGGRDYDDLGGAQYVLFENCAIRYCFAIVIVDDNMLEDSETFQVQFFRNGLHSSIYIDGGITQVIIKDNDCELTKDTKSLDVINK